MKKIITITISLIALNIFSFNPAIADSNPMFVTISGISSCSTCKKFEPIREELEQEYGDRVTFITLDVSSKASLEKAREDAEFAGISKFFEDNKGSVPTVGILCPGGEKVEKIFLGEINKQAYEKILDNLLSNTTEICSL